MVSDTSDLDEEKANSPTTQVKSLLDERDRLIHDLEVHQAELEAQNAQLREAGHQLEESHARYSDLYDFAPVAYCTLDRDGCISEINLTGAAMLGTQRGRAIGKPFAVYVSEPDRAAFRTHLQRRFSSPQGPSIVDFTLASSAEQPIVVQMVSSVARDQSGSIVGCRSAFTDISEQKRAEHTLHLAVHMREKFLAIVSHDLLNPLQSISLGTEVLLHSPMLDATSLRNVELIHNAAGRMRRMLSDLLDLSSMEAGHLSVERKMVSVEALLSATVENVLRSATAGAIQLDTVPHEPHMVALCDRDRILQVLINLAGNAIKFSIRGARVRIEARRTRDEIEFAVRDSGTGIAKSQLEHIFDPYWQAPETAKLGTGLGLSIAKGIVESHDGRIWAESDAGRGTCVFFTVPSAPTRRSTADVNTLHARDIGVSRSRPIGRPPAVDGPPVTAERGPILVVDDDHDVRVLLTDLLRAEGYDVATATDGAEALDYLRAATTLPCLILLDLVMPNVDGWQFIEERNHDPRLVRIPVVLISGQVAARETARSLGLASYIEKPFGVQSFRAMLARVLDGTPAQA